MVSLTGSVEAGIQTMAAASAHVEEGGVMCKKRTVCT